MMDKKEEEEEEVEGLLGRRGDGSGRGAGAE